MLEELVNWDIAATLYINSFNSPASDAFWLFMSNKWVWAPFYLTLAGLLIWKIGWKRGLIMILATILCITCIDQFCNLVKDTVCRLRPCNDPDVIDQGLHILSPAHPNYPYGFFSGHASNAIGFAVCMIFSFRYYAQEHPEKKWAWHTGNIIVVTWAILVGLSRVFVAKHFFGDVLVGFLVGILIACCICTLANLVIRKYIKAPSVN